MSNSYYTATGTPSTSSTVTSPTIRTEFAAIDTGFTAVETAMNLKEASANKDATGGYAGLTQFKLNLKNAANTFTNFFTNATTAARTWTLPDKDGTVAMISDITGTNSGINTGDQINISGNAATVTTNANLTGHVTSVGNAAVLGSFTIAQLNTAVSDANVAQAGALGSSGITGAAESGSNSTITALTGLTTPLSEAQGGTGTTTGVVQLQPISASVGSSALTISASALSLNFRSTTLGSGTVTKVSGTPANLVISSGSTLGTTSGQLSRLAVLAILYAGAVELAAVNVASGLTLDETGVISTTAEGGAGGADSATTIYSTTAHTNVAYRVLGYIESTQATAGTWATAPSAIQGAGGKEIITSRITTSATVATTSGTSIDVTGIPTWAKLVRVVLDGVSGSGTSSMALQLGTASGVESSGYVGTVIWVTVNVNATATPAASFQLVYGQAATDNHYGWVELLNLGGGKWEMKSSLARTASSIGVHFSGGGKTVSGSLDRIRLTTVGGTDTFDAGSLTVTWE